MCQPFREYPFVRFFFGGKAKIFGKLLSAPPRGYMQWRRSRRAREGMRGRVIAPG